MPSTECAVSCGSSQRQDLHDSAGEADVRDGWQQELVFNYCYKSFKSEPQFYLHENFHRLIFSADEGTEAHSDVQPFV